MNVSSSEATIVTEFLRKSMCLSNAGDCVRVVSLLATGEEGQAALFGLGPISFQELASMPPD